MTWKNRALIRYRKLDSDHFASKAGIKIRRIIHPAVHLIIRAASDRPIEVIEYPNLVKGERYIFAAGHSFPGEIASNLAVIDRNAWVLIGTTDQVDHNPQMNFAWFNGLIYVNKLDPANRKDAFRKMKRILENGSSVLMFPEGVLNNSENSLCMPLYPGVYHLAVETETKVVPIVSHAEHGDKRIRVAAGKPIDFNGKTKESALVELRNALATIRYQMIEKSEPLKRASLSGDIHEQYLYHRRDTYLETKWVEPNWDEEIMVYKRKGVTEPEEVRAALADVNLTADNISILRPIFQKAEADKKYNITLFMKSNWNAK